MMIYMYVYYNVTLIFLIRNFYRNKAIKTAYIRKCFQIEIVMGYFMRLHNVRLSFFSNEAARLCTAKPIYINIFITLKKYWDTFLMEACGPVLKEGWKSPWFTEVYQLPRYIVWHFTWVIEQMWESGKYSPSWVVKQMAVLDSPVH